MLSLLVVINRIAHLVIILFLLVVPATHTIAQDLQATPATAPATLNYQAPTVTLLPDNKLYTLQLIWDKLSLLFASGTNKTAQYITLADRDLTAASKLMENGNSSLALHTAFRGEHYMTMLVDELKAVAYSAGTTDTPTIDRAHRAFPYHQQLISQMISKTTGQNQTSLMAILEFSQRNDGELTNLQKEYSLGQ